MSEAGQGTETGVIYQDARNQRIYIEQNGIIVAAFSMSEWSKMIANPRASTRSFDFSRDGARS